MAVDRESFRPLIGVGEARAAERLSASVAARSLTRLGAAARVLERSRAPRRALVAQARATLGAAGPRAASVLFGGALRGALAGFEQASRIAEAARAALALPRGSRRDAREAELFSEIAGTRFLVELVPGQVPDAGFARRAERLGRRLFAHALDELALVLAVAVPSAASGLRQPLVAQADPELALAAGEHALPGTGLVLVVRGAEPASLEIRSGRARVLRGRSELLAFDLSAPEPARRPGARLERLEPIPGSPSLLLGRRLVSRPGSLVVGARAPEVAAKLGAALALLERVWAGAWREVHTFTELVVPLDEPGTVSYSLLARPGVSYINVWGKSLLELSDDLLHETAHHKLHALEELGPLVATDDEDPAWWSPWRRAWRPLRGIVHASYTFAHAALLFARLDAAEPQPRELSRARRRFARRRLVEEQAMLAFSVADLGRAEALLAPAGQALASRLARLVAGPLRRAARQAEAGLAADPAGAGALAALGRLRRALASARAAQPGRSAAGH